MILGSIIGPFRFSAKFVKKMSFACLLVLNSRKMKYLIFLHTEDLFIFNFQLSISVSEISRNCANKYLIFLEFKNSVHAKGTSFQNFTKYRHFSHVTKNRFFKYLNLPRKANSNFCGNLYKYYFRYQI